ncbi:hypothetical protein Ahy_A08g040572 [Arachis hypogaea]|uniref:Uncharacterized protein n=1 Tax=Arachis hypogaea TaxID=3818 RepID=A0A445BZM1_ARAHY|nr:hypothetical protein Ahy_A08g040572 [Arachis hypogaea]
MAILFIPVPMSWSSFPVGIASSKRRNGRVLGVSWNARLTLDFLWPNSVPVILLPPCICRSPGRVLGTVGILHGGTTMGNDRNVDLNFRKNLSDLEGVLLLLYAGCREIGMLRAELFFAVAPESSLCTGGFGGGGGGGWGCGSCGAIT